MIKIKNFRSHKFLNILHKQGKTAISEKILKKIFISIKLKKNKNPYTILQKAILNTRPLIDIKSVRRGGTSYQTPVALKEERQFYLAILWIIQESLNKPGINLIEKLTNEIIETSKKKSASVKKKNELHRLAQKNRAFLFF
jgi:small subunit ribosomal protein S7